MLVKHFAIIRHYIWIFSRDSGQTNKENINKLDKNKDSNHELKTPFAVFIQN